MSHGHAHDATDVHDDPEPISTWVSSGVFVLLTVITIALVAAFYLQADRADVDRAVVDAPDLALADLKASQTALLTTYGSATVDVDGKPVKKIRIPVARAMEIVVAESRQPKVAATK